jgi:hypothetical protein
LCFVAACGGGTGATPSAAETDPPTSSDGEGAGATSSDPDGATDGVTGGSDDGTPPVSDGDTGDDTGATTTGDDPGTTGEPSGPGLGCAGRNDLLLCDDFEGGAIDDVLWTILADNGATANVDGDLPFEGGYGLHLHLPAADAVHSGLRTAVPFPVADNHLFGRAMFYLDPEVPQTHSSALAARGDLDGALAQYRLDCNGGEFNSRYTHTPTVEQHGGLRKFGYYAPAGQWLCIEWEYDGGNDTMRYWMDGEEIESMTVTADSEPQPWIAPVFEDFEVGYRTFQAGSVAEGYDVYWDAVALATFRIGCGD